MDIRIERDKVLKGAGIAALGVGIAAIGYAAYRQVKKNQEKRC